MAPHPWRAHRRFGFLALLALATACSTPSSVSRNSPTWLQQGVAQGLPMDDPLALRPETKERVRVEASTGGSERSQMRRLVRYLVDEDGLGFRYRPTRTLNAEQAFAAREGDCMSYALLYVAAARSLGLHVHFVRITQVPVFWEENGRFFTSSHIAVAHGHDTWVGEAMVVDYSATHTSAWRFALYDELDDETAMVLYFSNRAVELLLTDKVDQAEALLRHLLDHGPAVAEVYNNLGIVLMRQNRQAEAVNLYARGISLFPTFVPLYSNGVSAASGLGRRDLAEHWAVAGREIGHSSPAFTFAEGMLAFRRQNFSAAAGYFERALEVQPDDLTLLAWTARAHLAAGEMGRGQSNIDRMRRQKFTETQRTLLGDLQREFPAAGIELPVAPTATRT
jgi:tetratricopeptide (TPR) repeat protein